MAITSALQTVGQYITECRRLLQDQIAPFRYPDADLVDALNVGMQEARRLRADLFIPANFVVSWVDPAGSTTVDVPMDPMYRSALVYYMIGRAQLRDDEATTDQRASAFMAKFTSQLLVISS